MEREALQKLISDFNPKSRIIDTIAIHCTATKEGMEYSVTTIEKWHKARGFTQIGYHFIIHLDGTIDPGRTLVLPGAHVEGKNAHSIGVCYVGGLDANGAAKDTRTSKQKEALEWLLARLVDRIPTIKEIKGHRDFPRVKKACPCFDAIPEYKHLLEKA